MKVNLIAAYLILVTSVIGLLVGFSLLIFKKKHKIWWFAGLMLITVLCLQVSLNVAYPYDFDMSEVGKEPNSISGFEIFTRVISYTFQSFSLDAGYIEIIRVGELAFPKIGAIIFSTMVCLMTFIAPATGGFAVFGVLCHFFPYLKLLLFSYRRTKYIFSELNEYSIETAESIYNTIKNGKSKSGCDNYDWKWLKSSVIIFTDTYIDEKQELSSELLERAKNIGAICLKNDISELNLFWIFRIKYKKAIFFLIDKNEENNLNASVSILSYEHNKWAAKRKLSLKARIMEMYVFSRNDDANKIISGAYERLVKEEKTQKYEVLFKTINEHRNLIYNLIDENSYPLYYKYIESKDSGKMNEGIENLSILILGGGRIGKEFFKAAYWCGQMLSSLSVQRNYNFNDVSSLPYNITKLKITIIAEDAEETQKNLNFLMPEVFDKQYSTYCKFEFLKCRYATSLEGQSNEDSEGFEQLFLKKCKDVDYVLVALGSDNLNINAAHWIQRTIDKLNLNNLKKVPINYIVENHDLINALEESQEYIGGSKLNPFGSLSQRYEINNIVMSELEKRAWIIHKTVKDDSEKNEFINDNYKRNSSEAAAIHLSVKAKIFEMEDFIKGANTKELKNAACWLEHRRWCAFMRTNGYRCPTANEFFTYAFQKQILGKNPEHKFETLKLHPCLIESGIEMFDVEKYLQSLNSEQINKLSAEWETKKIGISYDTTLYEWLNNNVAENENHLDALDRLGIFISVYYRDALKGKILDFKKNDLNVVELKWTKTNEKY